MLSSALPLARQLAVRPIGQRVGAQWLVRRPNRIVPQVGCPRALIPDESRLTALLHTQRTYADSNTKPSIHDSDTIVLPGTKSATATRPQPPPPGPVLNASPVIPTPTTPTSEKIVPPRNMPLVPPTHLPGGKVQTAPPTSIPPTGGSKPIPPNIPPPTAPAPTRAPPSPPTPPPPPPPKRRSGRFRRFLLYLIVFGGLGYAGGVYYSLLSDNFHDFFTEYVPFGEEAVLFFEEREYRKRFPGLTNPTSRPPVDSGNRITIPSKSGVSWKVAGEEHQTSDATTKGKHMSATGANRLKGDQAQQNPAVATGAEKDKAVEKAKGDAKPSSSPPPKKPAVDEKSAPASQTPTPKTLEKKKSPEVDEKSVPLSKPTESKPVQGVRPPEVNEPSRIMPLEPLDPLKIKNADEPLVQDLVKILNDIIIVVNSDGAPHKYSSTVNKAKSALKDVGSRIMTLKDAEKSAADEKIKSTQAEFDTAAKELVRRLEEEMRAQEGQWKTEFESAREEISQSYQSRLEAETKRAHEVSEQKLHNQLLEQAVALKKQFLTEVTSRVETERNGRLAKLSDLSSSVTELEKLTADWNSVIDANLKTQHLQVAVEAVRSSLENADRPRPFVRELAALKEIASNDPVINAAIASINPTAYQRGVPTSAQLIDRFRRVAAEVRKAALLPEDAGVASHAASYVLSNFLFKKKGMTVGDDVESILTRTETLLEEGNLDEAAREMNGLEGWAKTLSWDWLSEARRVLEVRQALEVMSAEARLEGLRVDG